MLCTAGVPSHLGTRGRFRGNSSSVDGERGGSNVEQQVKLRPLAMHLERCGPGAPRPQIALVPGGQEPGWGPAAAGRVQLV